MSLIRKNPNEVLYPTGKKNIITIIKNEAPPQIILWRVPYEDFNEGSKVIVAENEEALFYKNGVIEGSFTGGEYTLNTDNYPFLSRIRNFVSGGISAYNCRIIFVNKVHQLDNRWGTDGPIQVVDPKYNITINLMARGAYTIQLSDAKKLYMKFAGSTASAMTADDINGDMRAPVNQKIKSTIAQVVSNMNAEVVGISSRLEEIAEGMRSPMEEVFDEYGIRMVNFYIEAIEIVEDESYGILRKARADAAAKIIYASSAKAEVDILGNDFGRVKTADIMMSAANNPSNSTVGDGLGLGAGMAVGGVMGASAMGVLSPLSSPMSSETHKTNEDSDDRFKSGSEGTFVAGCGHTVSIGVKFCPECGRSVKVVCPNCGNEVSTGAKFCGECGGRLL